VPEEALDALCGLPEDGIGNPLLVRAQAERAHVVEPCGHRVAAAVGQAFGGGEVDLVPASLGLDPRTHGASEHAGGQAGHDLGEFGLARRR
jgi:hypothetical protein